jgi:hypothetical protein
MKEIRISPTVQMITLISLVGAIVAGVVAQLPEVRRYLKIDGM